MVSAYVAIYLTAGLVWCMWNSGSKPFRAVAERMYEGGNFAWLMLALALGSLLWPIGLAGNMMCLLAKMRRSGREGR